MKRILKILCYPIFKGYLFLAKKFLQRKKIISFSSGEIRLSYARMVPKNARLIHGGRVKLSCLAQLYPEQKNGFNILYLTSSAMPRLVKDWVGICKKAKVKIVWNQDGVGYFGWAGKNYENVNIQMREIMQDADWVIYQSEFCKMSADKFLGKFNGPYSIIYNCVDTNSFSPSTTPLPAYPLKLLVMGTHENSYRVNKAIETVAVLKRMKIDTNLNIAGRLVWPGAKREVIKRIDSLGLSGSVVVTGPYLQKEALSLYCQSHILLHLKYKDPCPTVIIEALACGIPVVGSNSGGVPELIGEDGGIALEVPESWEELYAPETAEIAEAVARIMKNWFGWSKKARGRTVNNFSKEKWLKEHRKIFYSLITNK